MQSVLPRPVCGQYLLCKVQFSTIGGTTEVGDNNVWIRGTMASWASLRKSDETLSCLLLRCTLRSQENTVPGDLMSGHEAIEGRNPEDGFIVQNPWGCEQIPLGHPNDGTGLPRYQLNPTQVLAVQQPRMMRTFSSKRSSILRTPQRGSILSLMNCIFTEVQAARKRLFRYESS